jgi:N-acetylmuramoyl-L-alanine amidase
VLIGIATTLSSFYLKKDDPKRKVKVIVIDPGHGGKDPGCSGHKHNEKTVALAVALKLGKLIEENIKDVKVIFTRKTDVFVDLEDRAKIANDNNADLFISIHCNAAGKPVMIKDAKTGKMRAKTYKNKKGKLVVVETTNPEPYGSETYVMGLKNEEGKMKVAQRENSAILLEDNYEKKYQGFDPDSEESYIIMSNYTSSYVIQSAGLALKIQEQYSKKAGRVDKGVHRQSIWVLWRTAMPSVLTEIGYLTNPQEEEFLGSEKGQNYLASSLFRAFRKYKDEQEGVKTTYNDVLENETPLEKEVHKTVLESEPEKIFIDKPEEGKDVKIIEDTTELTAKEKLATEKRYNELVAVADVAIKNKNYEQAKTLYGKAISLGIKDEGYAAKKITEVDSLLNKEKTDKENISDQEKKLKADEEALKIKEAKLKEEVEAKKKTELAKLESDRAIAEAKKKEDERKTKELKAKNDSIKKAQALSSNTLSVISNSAITSNTNTIYFKVQFASNDKEVDAKTKYNNVSDVSFYKAGVVYKYTSGNYSNLNDAVKQQTKLRELGYKDCFVVAFKNGNRMDINEARKIVRM